MERLPPLTAQSVTLARRALEQPLCDYCLGRLFSAEGDATADADRGRLLRSSAGGPPTPPSGCALCEGLLGEADALCDAVVGALEGYEYTTFLVGSTVARDLLEREASLAKALGLTPPRTLKQAVNREVGLRVYARVHREVDFDDPDIVAKVDTRFNTATLQVKSLYVRGRYRKVARGIPQTRWPCTHCRGRGCARCGNTGQMYALTVEGAVAGPLIEMVGGDGHALHGAGREDIDARMLGRGRPFVVEIRSPRRRAFDPAALAQAVRDRSAGLVEVEGLAACDKAVVAALKAANWSKTYRVLVGLEKAIKVDQIDRACAELSGSYVDQQTPLRVAHRRSDKIRRRRVEKVQLLRADGEEIELEVTGESGLYVKELMNGDEGRTQPSLAGILGMACDVRELDVTEIHDG
ncbi:MAG TPA: tRNA pseudouridine(54/55) synthase Pus10 [Candidatus Thermoplasmatota archaeon]